jgi:anti-sigma B factor antagonist
VPRVGVSTGNPVIALTGQIDLSTADAVVAALEPWVRAGGPVTLDMSEVTFMDSTGLHALVMAAKSLGERGCIIVHGAHGVIATLFRITKIDGKLENLHLIECEVLVPAA